MLSSLDHYIHNIKALTCFDGLICAIERLHLGLSHYCFIVTAVKLDNQKSTKYFVKSLSHHLSTENNERLAAEACALSKISPEVIFHSTDWLVTEYIEGYTLYEKKLSLAEKIAFSMKLLHELHQLPHPKQLSSLSLNVLIEQQISENAFSEAQQLFLTQLNQQITSFEQNKEPVICHGDLNFSNMIIDKKGKAWLVDFECAAIGCAEYDVAMFIAINHLSKDELPQIMKGYQGGNNKTLEPALIQSYLACCYLVNGLWYQEMSMKERENGQYIELAYQQYHRFDLLNLSDSKLVDKLL